MGDRAYKESHKRQGLCTDCFRPARVGKTRCLIHTQRLYKWNRTEKAKIIQQQKKKYRRENGYCLICGKKLDPDADEGKLTCINCREKSCR
jgi:NADH pyrophosphatase NudC (nudix superfamily)